MGTANKIPDLNRTGESPNSKLDLLSGKHTTTMIVAILFVITLICLIVIVCVKENLPENVLTGLIGLLGVLAGFFAGSNIKKEN